MILLLLFVEGCVEYFFGWFFYVGGVIMFLFFVFMFVEFVVVLV